MNNPWQTVKNWYNNRRTAYISPDNAPEIKPGLGAVFAMPLPPNPSSMTQVATPYDRNQPPFGRINTNWQAGRY